MHATPPSPISIRRLRMEDVPAADVILQRAHNVDRSYALILRTHVAVSPDLWWMLESEGIPRGLVGATGLGSLAHIGLMAMDPSGQRSGQGGVLLDHLLAQLDQLGYTSVTLFSTDAGLRFYLDRGFTWQGLSTEWQLRKWRHVAASEIRIQPASLDQILDLDREATGVDRAPFLSLLFDSYPGRCFAATDAEGHLAGYAMALERNIGPWIAKSPSAAAALLGTLVPLYGPAGPRVILPEAHAEGESLLIHAGFAPARTSRYFLRGKPFPQRRDWMYGAIAYSVG